MSEKKNDITADTSKTSQPIEIFYSYSHKDEDLRNELEKHLSLLKRNGVIAGWHDRKIVSGAEWSGEIDKHLEASNIILLLVSSDFIASDYCYEIEMKRAMERHEQRAARVIPIILRRCDWHDAPFGKLQALPKDGKPIKTWNDIDEAFTDVVAGLKRTIAEVTGVP
jgi:TIR domain